jgi:hypothetical protein
VTVHEPYFAPARDCVLDVRAPIVAELLSAGAAMDTTWLAILIAAYAAKVSDIWGEVISQKKKLGEVHAQGRRTAQQQGLALKHSEARNGLLCLRHFLHRQTPGRHPQLQLGATARTLSGPPARTLI